MEYSGHVRVGHSEPVGQIGQLEQVRHFGMKDRLVLFKETMLTPHKAHLKTFPSACSLTDFTFFSERGPQIQSASTHLSNKNTVLGGDKKM